ncbi:MAG: transporter [Urechidicola sp.]|nr:transporter [Urechidicola sp.]
MKKYICMVVAMISLTITAQNENHEEHQHQEIDSIKNASCCVEGVHHHTSNLEAPISVMGSHMHEKGSWMVSYRFMNMQMKGLRQGTDDISNTQGHDTGYMVTPLEMGMNMHMIGAMYAPSDKLTLIAMFNIVQNDMDMQMRMMSGMVTPFSTSSSAFGDIKIAGLYNFKSTNKYTLHGQLGFSLPTGSIDSKDVTPMSNGNEVILPYPMQIGSGTFDTDLGLTYVGKTNSLSWGHQLKGTFRLGENSNNYRLGNQYVLDNWLAIKVLDWMSVSGRLEGVIVDGISGANPDLNPMMATTSDTANSGGTYINGGLGLNTYLHNDLQIGAEFELPLFQDVNGIQLKQQHTLTLGLLYTF